MGKGRPKNLKGSTRWSFWLDEENSNKLKELSKRMKVPKAEVVRIAISRLTAPERRKDGEIPDVGLYEGMLQIEHQHGDGIDYIAISILDIAHNQLASATMRPDQFARALTGDTQSVKIRVEDDKIAKMERHPARVWRVVPSDIRDGLVSLLVACRDRAEKDPVSKEEWTKLHKTLGAVLNELTS